MILKKTILQENMRKKKIPAQGHRPKKKFTHVQWAGKKILARCSPCWHSELLYQQPVKKVLASGLGYLDKRGIHSAIICSPQIAFSLNL